MPIASIARRLLGGTRRPAGGRPAGGRPVGGPAGPTGAGSTDAKIGRGVRTALRRFMR